MRSTGAILHWVRLRLSPWECYRGGGLTRDTKAIHEAGYLVSIFTAERYLVGDAGRSSVLVNREVYRARIFIAYLVHLAVIRRTRN
jgi:hypothetical protein